MGVRRRQGGAGGDKGPGPGPGATGGAGGGDGRGGARQGGDVPLPGCDGPPDAALRRHRGGEPRKLEHADIRWKTPAEAKDYPFCPADRIFLERLEAQW